MALSSRLLHSDTERLLGRRCLHLHAFFFFCYYFYLSVCPAVGTWNPAFCVVSFVADSVNAASASILQGWRVISHSCPGCATLPRKSRRRVSVLQCSPQKNGCKMAESTEPPVTCSAPWTTSPSWDQAPLSWPRAVSTTGKLTVSSTDQVSPAWGMRSRSAICCFIKNIQLVEQG